MNSARFIFHGELNFFLARQHKNQPIDYAFNRRASVKDMVEALGVPHPEVQFLLVNDRSVGWNCIVQPGDVVQAFAELNGAGPEHGVALVPPYQGRPRFVLDTHLGRLAGYLRMMGFDTLYRNDYDDEELAHISHHKQRILLTRDIGLLKRSIVIYGYYVRSTQPRQRLAEVIRRYGLAGDIQPFYTASAATGCCTRPQWMKSPPCCLQTLPFITTASTAAPPAGRFTGKARIMPAWSVSSRMYGRSFNFLQQHFQTDHHSVHQH